MVFHMGARDLNSGPQPCTKKHITYWAISPLFPCFEKKKNKETNKQKSSNLAIYIHRLKNEYLHCFGYFMILCLAWHNLVRYKVPQYNIIKWIRAELFQHLYLLLIIVNNSHSYYCMNYHFLTLGMDKRFLLLPRNSRNKIHSHTVIDKSMGLKIKLYD